MNQTTMALANNYIRRTVNLNNGVLNSDKTNAVLFMADYITEILNTEYPESMDIDKDAAIEYIIDNITASIKYTDKLYR